VQNIPELDWGFKPNYTRKVVFALTYTLASVFIEFAVFILLFSFVLERNDNKTNEDIHHEEGNDNDEDNIEDGYPFS